MLFVSQGEQEAKGPEAGDREARQGRLEHQEHRGHDRRTVRRRRRSQQRLCRRQQRQRLGLRCGRREGAAREGPKVVQGCIPGNFQLLQNVQWIRTKL